MATVTITAGGVRVLWDCGGGGFYWVRVRVRVRVQIRFRVRVRVRADGLSCPREDESIG